MPDDSRRYKVALLAALANRLPAEQFNFAFPACLAILKGFYDEPNVVSRPGPHTPRHQAKALNLAPRRVVPTRERAS